ncbi:MAG TPA: NADH-quinone oxidoreductase subunit NuoG [Wenzhouxiangella sp.]
MEKQDVQMVTLEIDGQSVSVPAGSMIIEASDQIGVDIPRFCYHHKLSIAANCRMCLVDVEKAPKPLPACATPVADGMRVFTESRRAVDAQRGVMEFLLINHPLDCPICDQGGECELQDLAMGYGRSVSRFTERKRVVKDKNLGSLVATDMTRCIHCTRCVRFLEEIAGTTELGGIGRGENTEISTFVERNINSELSGNIIDLCPVGALTNKPFRFSARPWEMRAKPAVAGHDNVGSNLFYHVRGKQIMRSVPKDNERINECWLPDRDRYSHFGLAAKDRLQTPKVKVNGTWADASWSEALAVATRLLSGTAQDDPAQLGVLVSPRATNQEHFLLQKLTRALGSENIDHRLRVSDFSDPHIGRARMDMASADWVSADAIFLVGSNIRHDQPILGHRVRTAWRKAGAEIMDLNPVAYECHFELSQRLITAPQHMVGTLATMAALVAQQKNMDVPDWVSQRVVDVDDQKKVAIEHILGRLQAANKGLIVLGDGGLNHPQASLLQALVDWLSGALEVSLCVLGGPSNAQGAHRMGAVPGAGGLNAGAMLASPLKTYLLYDFEPQSDTADSGRSLQTLEGATGVVAITAFASEDLLSVADVLLPLASVPQTEGTYINLEGVEQYFEAAVSPTGDARPGWKILRRLGVDLGLSDFDFIDVQAINEAIAANSDAPKGVKNISPETFVANVPLLKPESGLSRIGDVPMYHCDGLVRRSKPLQDSDHASAPIARLHPETANRLKLTANQRVDVTQNGHTASFDWAADERIALDAVWLPTAQAEVSGLGESYGVIQIQGCGQ